MTDIWDWLRLIFYKLLYLILCSVSLQKHQTKNERPHKLNMADLLCIAAAFISLRFVVCEEFSHPSKSVIFLSGNFASHKNQKLFGGKLKDAKVESSDECLIECVQTRDCLSVNFNTTGDEQGLFVCEILATNKFENQSNFRPSEGIDHYTIAVSSWIMYTDYRNLNDDHAVLKVPIVRFLNAIFMLEKYMACHYAKVIAQQKQA